eukprot:gene19716-biopygen2634
MHIRTDSKYVQLGIELYRHRWRSDGWYKNALRGEEIDHADLWQKVDNLIRQRRDGDFKIAMQVGHRRHARKAGEDYG